MAPFFPVLFFFLLSNPSNALNLTLPIGGGGISFGGGGSHPPSGYHPPSAPSTTLQPCDFVNMKQYYAYKVIQRFKKTITCDPKGITQSWVGPKVCNYLGFACDTPPKAPNMPTIAVVDFNGYQIAAPTVCGFANQLPDLAFFHANTNNFSDTVPDLSGLQYIYEVDFSNNRLTGQFPAVVNLIKQLLFLDIRYNFYTGSVPVSVFNIPLVVLFLNNNGFSGYLPPNLGNTTAKYLTLANNFFTGPIPSSIGNAAKTLVEVLFLNNKLSGCLPFQIGLLSKATVFDAGTNLLSGQIPQSFGCLSKIQQLNLAQNKLFGDVPDIVCRLPNLQNLSLSDNYFTSIGPSCYILLKKGILDIRKNCIPGCANQRSPEECSRFACGPKSCPDNPNKFKIPCEYPWCKGGYVPPPQHIHRRKSISVSRTYAALRKPES